jgi:hypothetical protein
MKKHQLNKLILLTGIILFISCSSSTNPIPQKQDSITFGDYYGMCAGTSCVNIFLYQEGKIFADTSHKYPNTNSIYEGKWFRLPDEKIIYLDSAFFSIPDSLFIEKNTIIGQPDAYDQGGIYLEIYKNNGFHKYWLIDNDVNNLPAYLQKYIENLKKIIQLMKK